MNTDITTTSTETSPEVWAAKIAALTFEKEVVKATARIVWWDHFSKREYTERWSHLDKWLGYDGSEIDDATLQMALIKVGYSPQDAKKRVKAKD